MPTHLQMPDQVLTLWSFSLTARQLLLLLVGGGIGGTLWQHLTVLGHYAVPGEIVRLLLSLPPFLLALFIAWYQHAGRYLEIWMVVLVRYRLRPETLPLAQHPQLRAAPLSARSRWRTIVTWKR